MNSLNIMGRLTRDPELRYTPTGSAIVNFSIAVNEGFGEQQKTHFFNVEAWKKTAEIINQYVNKGDRIFITGSLKQNRWEKDGEKKSRVIITVHRVIFDGKKGTEEVNLGE